MVLRYKFVSETKKWIKKICFFTLTILRRCKFQNSRLIEKISLIFLCATPRHFSSPISTVVQGRRGLVSTNNSKTRPIISDSHHDRTIFPRGMAGQRYSRYYRGAIESRYLVHEPAPLCFVRCCCRPVLATRRFRWTRYARAGKARGSLSSR